MSTESISEFRADPAAVSELGSTYERSSAALSAQATRFTAAAAMAHSDAFGPVGSVFTAALTQAAGQHAAQIGDIASRLAGAHRTATDNITAFVDADARVATHLGGLR